MSDASPDWFRALVESTPDVYFRYRLVPPRRFDYLSPSVDSLTGHRASAFHDDPGLCLGIVRRDDRHVLRQILRARRGLTVTLHIRRGRLLVPIELHTITVVQARQVVAIEGVARTLELPLFARGAGGGVAPREPTQQRLMALMGEVHALLHRALPPVAVERRVLRLGDLVFDLERLAVTEHGVPVALTSRETLVLRYLLQQPHRVVTRGQILADVWGADFDGNDRTVDVHVSRLRGKLASLRDRLVAVKGIGYRLEGDDEAVRAFGA